MEGQRKRIAIVGGGPASLAAAYHLSVREPDVYDITIYEASWRLGGKTASGRGEHGRIEEHGLHVLFGCYHNVFDLMHDCYDRLVHECAVGPERHIFQHFFDAVEPRHFGVIGDDRFDGREQWLPWYIQFACNRGVPGEPPLPSVYALICTIVQAGVHVLFGARGLRAFQSVGRWFLGYKRHLPRKPRPLPEAKPGGADASLGGFGGRLLLRLAEHALDDQTLVGRLVRFGFASVHRLVRRLSGLNRSRFLRRGAVGTAWTVLDFSCAVVKGIFEHGLLVSDARRRSDRRARDASSQWGFYDRIDVWDFRDWLGHHGASPGTQASPLVRMIYDASFSYQRGGRPNPETGDYDGERMGAGTVLRIMLLMGITYKHAFYFKMRAGMGDVIAAPIYEVLRKRNITFKFFHRLTAITPGWDEDGNPVIDALQITKLARTRGDAEYHPLEKNVGLLSWPSQPHSEQIEPEDYEDACNAERYFHKSARPLRSEILRRNAEFDSVILGIPSSCIPYVCADLIADGKRAAARSPSPRDDRRRWADVSSIAATQTVALQLWFKLSLRELGWSRPPPLLSLFYDPLNTWCDMSQTLSRERWPRGTRPRSVAYFCGPLQHLEELFTPAQLRDATPEDLKRFDARIRAQGDAAVARLLENLSELLPNLRGPQEGSAFAFNWSLLADPQHRRGPARLNAQYVRVNYEPSERCTVALPGQTALRIQADGTGYLNLVVAGDWTKNGINAACFEGAVQSGIRAARAISSRPALYVIRAERLLNLEVDSKESLKLPPIGKPTPRPRNRLERPQPGEPFATGRPPQSG